MYNFNIQYVQIRSAGMEVAPAEEPGVSVTGKRYVQESRRSLCNPVRWCVKPTGKHLKTIPNIHSVRPDKMPKVWLTMNFQARMQPSVCEHLGMCLDDCFLLRSITRSHCSIAIS